MLIGIRLPIMAVRVVNVHVEHVQLVIARADLALVVEQQAAGGDQRRIFTADQRHRPHQQPDAITPCHLAHRILQRPVALVFSMFTISRRIGEQQRVLRRHHQFYPGIELLNLLFNLGQVITHPIATAQL
ncbi:hypothetical protein D3C78_1095880 [compost metagenome]